MHYVNILTVSLKFVSLLIYFKISFSEQVRSSSKQHRSQAAPNGEGQKQLRQRPQGEDDDVSGH